MAVEATIIAPAVSSNGIIQAHNADSSSRTCHFAAEPGVIAFLCAYFVVLPLVLIQGVVGAWPAVPDTGAPIPLLFGLVAATPASADARLLVIVALMGALGSYVRVLFHFSEKEPNQWSAVRYALAPFLGVAVALICYLTVEAGLLGGRTSTGSAGFAGTAGLAGAVGLCSREAIVILRKWFKRIAGETDSAPTPAR